MKRESIYYEVIGLLLGIILAGLAGSYAVNNKQGMLGMSTPR